MIRQCEMCGCACLLDEMWERYGCPTCRSARVAEAFRPIDPLRTALGIGMHWHGEEKIYADTSRTEVPKGCKMPKGDAAQVYELKRMRKLIGRI